LGRVGIYNFYFKYKKCTFHARKTLDYNFRVLKFLLLMKVLAVF
jgi:hypothetical protein